MMRRECWIRNVYGVKCGRKIIKAFGIFIAKNTVNDYWIVGAFGIVCILAIVWF